LDLDCASHRINCTRKQNQQPIAGRPYDPAPMFRDFGVHEGIMVSGQPIERAFIVSA
jgi:hypothetical protein